MAKKRFNPFKTKTIERKKVNGVKCWLKVLQKKVVERVRIYQDGVTVWRNEIVGYEDVCYYVGASDGSSRREVSKEKAMEMYERLVEFEKRQKNIEVV